MCNKNLPYDMLNASYLKLYHYFEIERSQCDITDLTYDVLCDALSDLRPEEICDGD